MLKGLTGPTAFHYRALGVILFSVVILALPAGAVDPEAEKGEQTRNLETFFPEPATIHPEMTREEYAEYDRGALFDYINGGAEVYLDLGFIKVGAIDYLVPFEEETYFTLDIYDMGALVNAFGIYSQERYGDVPEVDLGNAGYLAGGSLMFWAGQYYVKIRADDDSDAVDKILVKLGRAVSGCLGDPGGDPPELALFPTRNRKAKSEKYTSGNLMGFGFLKGFSCTFERKKEEMRLHLCHYDSEKEALEAEKKLVQKIKPAPRPAGDGPGFVFESKYQGHGRFLRVGSYLAVAQQEGGEKEKADWKPGLITEFFTRLSEAYMKERAQKSLDKGLGNLGGD
ncbi:MAG: DUF6599 family protein [Planctomycetota bacterium]|jgi:hypothetical protein